MVTDNVVWTRALLLLIKIPDQLLHVINGSDRNRFAPVTHHQLMALEHRSVNAGPVCMPMPILSGTSSSSVRFR
jgi:hypothetical protein